MPHLVDGVIIMTETWLISLQFCDREHSFVCADMPLTYHLLISISGIIA